MPPGARPVRVVIQSRLSSSRLPGKALLQVGGMAAVLLCARRAANTGLPVCVATSDAPSDAGLRQVLAAAGIEACAGPLDDVLERFRRATNDLPDDAVVVRLTADNLFPDGAFVQDLVARFAARGGAYLGTASPFDGLPYGLSAEVFTARALRQAAAEATAPADREHVTPWIRRHLEAGRFEAADAPRHWNRLRCTIDTFDDFIAVAAAFEGLPDPVAVPWQHLVDRLAAASPGGRRPRCPWSAAADGSVHGALALGSAQFGMDYGVANRTGAPDDGSLWRLLDEAADAGVTCIDTARAYGSAEERLGRWQTAGRGGRLQVVTKLDVLQGVGAAADADAVGRAVDASVFRSLHALATRRLDGLLLHRWQHHDDWQGAAWRRLLHWRDAGLVQRLGASVSTVDQAVAALADPDITHLQCPTNVLDHRWRDPRFLGAAAARPDVVFHVRSVLLQGLLTLPAAQWPVADRGDADRVCNRLDALVHDLGRRGRADLCVAYVRSLPWVTSLVMGMETPGQLRDNLDLVAGAPLKADERQAVEAAFTDLPETLLDPAQWVRRAAQ